MNTLSEINQTVAEHYGISVEELCGPCKAQQFVRPRQMAMKLGRDVTDKSLTQIAFALGRRDHATVIHGVKQAQNHMQRDHEAASNYQQIKSKLTGAVFYRHGSFDVKFKTRRTA